MASTEQDTQTTAVVANKSISNEDHLLESKWSFWYSKKTSGSSASAEGFSSSLHQLGSFQSIEGFFEHYSFLKRPAEIPNNYSYMLFRNTIKPAWESFSDGGCMTLRLNRHSPYLGRLWEELMFASIGELWEEPKVVGVVVSKRPKGDAVSVWTTDSRLQHSIGDKMKRILQLESNTPLEYKPFNLLKAEQNAEKSKNAEN